MYGVANSLIRRLQSVQNATARLITGAKRQKHITPVLRQLHWLPVCQRVRFELACIMYKSLSGQAPSTWSMMSSYLLTTVGVYFDQPTTEHASFHGHRTVSATEPFLLPDLKSETICHRNCDTWTSVWTIQKNAEIVSLLTYLLTYLVTFQWKQRNRSFSHFVIIQSHPRQTTHHWNSHTLQCYCNVRHIKLFSSKFQASRQGTVYLLFVGSHGP